MINIQSGGIIGTAGVLATAVLIGGVAQQPDSSMRMASVTQSRLYISASADSSRANTVWIAVDESKVPTRANFQSLAIRIAEQQAPLSAEFNRLLANRFEDLLD